MTTELTEARAKAAKAVCDALLARTDPDEVINILLTAIGTMVTVTGNTKVRCMQIRGLADNLQAEAAMRGDAPNPKSTK